MEELRQLKPWVQDLAERYLGDCNDWNTNQIVEGLERVAYKMVRDGKSKQATRLFVAVADLTNSGATKC